MPPTTGVPRTKALLHSWSLAREILGRKLDIMSLPEMAAKAGFHGIEWLDRLMPSFEPTYWDELAGVQKRAGMDASAFSLSMDLTASPSLIAVQKDRAQAILSLCPRLGVKAVRVSIGGGGPMSMAALMLLTQPGGKRAGEPQPLNSLGRGLYKLMLKLPHRYKKAGELADPLALQSAAWSLQPLVRQAANLGIGLSVENHYGLTSHPKDILTLLDLVNDSQASQGEHENRDAGWAERTPLARGGMGVCLDTGNYPQGIDPAQAAGMLAPHTAHVHWKLRSNPVSKDERRNLALHAEALKAAGFAGVVSVEYEGPGCGLDGAVHGLVLLRELMG
jgi:sugar phosphate isomerase/epimerase